jgi:hypothetical protein
MTKILVGAAIGVFVGAFTVEILNRKSPTLLRGVEDGAAKLLASVGDAFKAGYRGADAKPAA